MVPEIPVLIFSAVVVLIAGFVRGYSGFGFAMIMVICLSLIFPPAKIVPAVLLLDVASSIWLMPRIWQQVDWTSLGWLYLGVLGGSPVGVYLLATVPERPMRAAIAIVVLILVVLLQRGFKLRKMPGKSVTITTGLISGLINGTAAIGGPPVILFYFSSPAGIAVSRASLIAFFLGTDILASGLCAAHGLITTWTILLSGILLVPLVIGLNLGSRSFIRAEPEAFRKRVLLLLLVISIVILVRATSGL